MVAASTWALGVAVLVAVGVAYVAAKLVAEGQTGLLWTYAVHAVAALVLLALMAFVGLYLLFSETRSALLVGNGTKIATPVAVGVVEAYAKFDTQNQLMPNYVPIARSFNRLGGAELSYAFWVRKRNNVETLETSETAPADPGLDVQDIVLLLKGNKVTAKTTSQGAGTKFDVIVKAPLIKFDRSTDRLTVEFNTSDPTRVNGVLEGASVGGAASLPARAAHATQVSVYGLNDPKFNARWFHVAVVLKDNDPDARVDRNIQARIFVNGEAVFDRNVVGTIAAAPGGGGGGATLRQNDGFLHLLPKVTWTDGNGHSKATLDSANAWVTTSPTGPLKVDASGALVTSSDASKLVDVKLADVWHYNYALEDGDVKRLFARGVTHAAAAIGAAVPATSADDGYRMSEPSAWKRVQAE